MEKLDSIIIISSASLGLAVICLIVAFGIFFFQLKEQASGDERWEKTRKAVRDILDKLEDAKEHSDVDDAQNFQERQDRPENLETDPQIELRGIGIPIVTPGVLRALSVPLLRSDGVLNIPSAPPSEHE